MWNKESSHQLTMKVVHVKSLEAKQASCICHRAPQLLLPRHITIKGAREELRGCDDTCRRLIQDELMKQGLQNKGC